jgi:hypothetical protein
MRILTVCLALLLMAATAEAQGRGGGWFHGRGGGLHAGAPMFRDDPGLRPGFRPGFEGFDNRSVVISPFFGFPFYWTGIATQKENQKRGINVVIRPNTSQWRLR